LVPIPRDAFAEGRITKPSVVANTIQRLAGSLKVKGKSTATSISGYEVMIKKIELPMMTEQELADRMYLELGQYIPYNIDEVEVDFQVLDIAKDRSNYMEVLLVAAKKESVNDCLTLARMGGLEPVVVDVDFFALSNAYEVTHGLAGDQNILLLDIGASKSTMNIVARGVPLFTRDIPVGGYQITDRIREHFKISVEDAEKIKLGDIPDKLPTEELEDVFASTIENWVGEFKRAVGFFHSNYPDNKIEKIALSGGSCRIPGLDRVFQESMNTPVEIFNPLLKAEYDSKVFDPAYIEYIGPQMAIALGLSLRKTPEK
jgi:type IV pilus assembly protein PilM